LRPRGVRLRERRAATRVDVSPDHKTQDSDHDDQRDDEHSYDDELFNVRVTGLKDQRDNPGLYHQVLLLESQRKEDVAAVRL
jgi:hypothetical protein